MGILADQKVAVEQGVTEAVQPPIEAPRDFSAQQSSVEIPNLKASVVESSFDPIQSIQTSNRLASGKVVHRSDGTLPLHITPTIDSEVYAIDIVDENGKIVYSVNSHSGRFSGQIPLPKGEYTYFIKTQRNEMPFAVKWE